MANHLKRSRPGDIVASTSDLLYLGAYIPKATRGIIYGVETPGKVFRVRFDDYGPRVTRAEDLAVRYRPQSQ